MKKLSEEATDILKIVSTIQIENRFMPPKSNSKDFQNNSELCKNIEHSYVKKWTSKVVQNTNAGSRPAAAAAADSIAHQRGETLTNRVCPPGSHSVRPYLGSVRGGLHCGFAYCRLGYPFYTLWLRCREGALSENALALTSRAPHKQKTALALPNKAFALVKRFHLNCNHAQKHRKLYMPCANKLGYATNHSHEPCKHGN